MILTIERLGHLGDAMARDPAGAPIYVARALPGETIEGTPDGGRIAEARILTPSAARVRPPCPSYRACGGCSLQHAAEGFVADWKQDVVRQALSAQGLSPDMRPIVTSPAHSRRRATLSGRRMKKGALVGFHARASDTVVPITGCTLLDPALLACLPLLEDITSLGASRKAALALTVTQSEGGIDLAVSGGKPLDAALFADLARLAEEADLARLSWQGETIAARRPAAQRFGAARVVPPAGGFLQATPQGEAALLAAVRAALGLADPDTPPADIAAKQASARASGPTSGRPSIRPPAKILDLFAGAGTFALPLARQAEVHAVESEAAALAALEAGWRQAQGLKRVSTETRDLFRRPLLPDELSRYDALVIDPPRAGAEAQMAEIARARLPRLAAVSCNPVTFARDARILVAAGYRLDWVQVIDQFRWSPHVELAAAFSL